jgi:hypothetical protein
VEFPFVSAALNPEQNATFQHGGEGGVKQKKILLTNKSQFNKEKKSFLTNIKMPVIHPVSGKILQDHLRHRRFCSVPSMMQSVKLA